MEKSHHFSLSDLLCGEDDSCLNERGIKDLGSVSEFDDEYIKLLIQKESIFQSDGNGFSIESEGDWLKCARLDAIRWILETRAFFGFQFDTAYLSIIYLDIFLSRRSIDDPKLWAIRLLSVACLSVAAKMEECIVPALSEYHVDEFNFERNAIKKMELLVLSTLKWKMSLITPFAYLDYFSAKFSGELRCDELLKRAVELIIDVIKEVNVGEYRPSIIAATAVLASHDYALMEKDVEIKTNVIPSWESLEKEDLFSCYNLLRKCKFAKSNTPNSVILPNLSSSQSSSDHASENSSITSTVGVKRRLSYPDGDRCCPPRP
ncbi:cyclin-D5-1-like [Olea europaea subsp. europaea]|uniref:Cyclin-D5-1-like n=1 Tax=Olea europaea subsp. europaea TaxID=158383 RepID=A0A8S0PUG3_OLEEU|nr:cyclin-D5-1-like [Olea europaea subsp. europaea]